MAQVRRIRCNYPGHADRSGEEGWWDPGVTGPEKHYPDDWTEEQIEADLSRDYVSVGMICPPCGLVWAAEQVEE